MELDGLVALNAVFFTITVMLVGYAGLKMRRAKQVQNTIVQGLERGAHGSWFRVKLSRPAHFSRRLKLTGFEAAGVLVNDADEVRLIAEFEPGRRIEKRISKSLLRLEWLGNGSLASSNMHWIALGSGPERMMVTADTGLNAMQSREATADMCRMIDPAFGLPDLATHDFALEKNKASLYTVVAFFALGAYAIADWAFINQNELLSTAWLIWAAPAAMLSSLPAYALLVRHRVPARESMVLSLLFSMSVPLSLVPLAQRLDAALSDGARSYPYELKEGTRLEPVEPGPPSLNFRYAPEYWAQYEPGSQHSFSLIRGPLGLWQLEREELAQRVRAFYAERGEGRQSK